MSLTASLVGYIDPADDQRIPRLQPMEVEPVPDPKRKGLWGRGGDRGLVDVEGGGCGGRYGGSGRCSQGQSRPGPFIVGISGGDDAGARDGVRERRDRDRVLRKGGGGIQRCCCCHSHWSELGISTHHQTRPHRERAVLVVSVHCWPFCSLPLDVIFPRFSHSKIFSYINLIFFYLFVFSTKSEAMHYMRLKDSEPFQRIFSLMVFIVILSLFVIFFFYLLIT